MRPPPRPPFPLANDPNYAQRLAEYRAWDDKTSGNEEAQTEGPSPDRKAGVDQPRGSTSEATTTPARGPEEAGILRELDALRKVAAAAAAFLERCPLDSMYRLRGKELKEALAWWKIVRRPPQAITTSGNEKEKAKT